MGSVEQKIATTILTAIRTRRKSSPTQPSDLSVQPSGPVAPARLREAQFSDFSGVAELKQRGSLNADSFENWERLWRHNPALAGSEVERPIGWVLEADGVIVGYLGNISLLYRLGDRTLTAVTAHGLVVDTPYRIMALSLVAAFFRQKSVDLFVSTSAIEAVGKIALAFKSAPLPQPDYDTALFWVLQPYPFAQSLMKKLKLGPALAQLGSIAASLAVGTDKLLRRRWPKRSSTSFTVREISIPEIGDEFQALWSAKLNEKERLFADRNAAALRWHFEIPGDRGYARVLGCYEAGQLVGYAVVRSDTNEETGLRTALIADMVARQDDPKVVGALWAAAYDYAKQAGSHVLEVLGLPSDIRQVGAAWNPYHRKYPACPFYYKAADPELHKALSDGMAWYASPFDGDATLIRPSYPSSAPSDASPVRMKMGRDADEVIHNVPDGEPTQVC
jgi:hypothetical protein